MNKNITKNKLVIASAFALALLTVSSNSYAFYTHEDSDASAKRFSFMSLFTSSLSEVNKYPSNLTAQLTKTGPKTITLREYATPVTISCVIPKMNPKATGKSVTLTQIVLGQAGHFTPDYTTQFYGTKTVEAVKAFQKQKFGAQNTSYQASGIIDPATATELTKLTSEQFPAECPLAETPQTTNVSIAPDATTPSGGTYPVLQGYMPFTVFSVTGLTDNSGFDSVDVQFGQADAPKVLDKINFYAGSQFIAGESLSGSVTRLTSNTLRIKLPGAISLMKGTSRVFTLYANIPTGSAGTFSLDVLNVFDSMRSAIRATGAPIRGGVFTIPEAAPVTQMQTALASDTPKTASYPTLQGYLPFTKVALTALVEGAAFDAVDVKFAESGAKRVLTKVNLYAGGDFLAGESKAGTFTLLSDNTVRIQLPTKVTLAKNTTVNYTLYAEIPANSTGDFHLDLTGVHDTMRPNYNTTGLPVSGNIISVGVPEQTTASMTTASLTQTITLITTSTPTSTPTTFSKAATIPTTQSAIQTQQAATITIKPHDNPAPDSVVPPQSDLTFVRFTISTTDKDVSFDTIDVQFADAGKPKILTSIGWWLSNVVFYAGENKAGSYELIAPNIMRLKWNKLMSVTPGVNNIYEIKASIPANTFGTFKIGIIKVFNSQNSAIKTTGLPLWGKNITAKQTLNLPPVRVSDKTPRLAFKAGFKTLHANPITGAWQTEDVILSRTNSGIPYADKYPQWYCMLSYPDHTITGTANYVLETIPNWPTPYGTFNTEAVTTVQCLGSSK